MSEQKVEQRTVIKFLGENVPSAEIHHILQQKYGEECLSWTRVFEWCKCFREGRERVENEPHYNDAVIQTVREWIRRQPQAFFEKGIRMLPERWKNCVGSGGECVED